WGTETTLRLTNVQPTARQFGVVVSDAFGSVTSVLARLMVLVPPTITAQPTNQFVDVGATAIFTVQASGTAPLIYQWRINDANIPGKTNGVLLFANVSYTNAGGYMVLITNAAGSVTSRVATLSVVPTLHGFSGIKALGDEGILLSLTGSVRTLFMPYFDLYPVEASTNLADWTPLTSLLRTNAATNALTYLDRDTTNFDKRFYRTFTNQLPTAIPKPTGPYAVGTFSRQVIDATRTNRYNIPTNSSFMVSFWYPAKAEAGVLPTDYMEKKLASFISIPYFVCHSYSNAPFADGLTNCPIIIYSHGAGGYRVENTEKAEELASHGYVVASADHEDCGATVLPGDKLVLGLELTPFDALPSRLRDIQVVMDTLSQLELDASDPKWAGRLNLGCVGILGWSRGGGIAGEICRVDDRFKAAVLFAPALWWATNLLQTGVGKPFVCIVESTDPMLTACWRVCSESLFNKATQDAFWFQIQGALHYTFSQNAWIINDEQPPVGESTPTAATRSAAVTMRACMLSFFNKYLRNEDDHLLDDLSTVYTNVYNFNKK
ncbi:MAG TPA: immunoglobulin domain-containing protein, partial [Verrucomicrobiae bacterium]|nr:immunoglobulin domain-containing protein [Verrucomicrobiae bacterium]